MDTIAVRRVIALCLMSAALGGLLAFNAGHLLNLYRSATADGDSELTLPTKLPQFEELTPEAVPEIPAGYIGFLESAWDEEVLKK